MLSREQLELIWNIDIACRRCVRAAQSFDAITGLEGNHWSFTQNCFGEMCVIHWCQVFGGWAEPTHYSKMFADAVVTCIKRDDVKLRLQNAVSMNAGEYTVFREQVATARNKFMVHNEFSTEDRLVFPDLDQLSAISMTMREISSEIISQEQSTDQEYQTSIKEFLDHYTNVRFMDELALDILALKSAISS